MARNFNPSHQWHFTVATSTHGIFMAELSLPNVTDTEVLSNLLKQTLRRII